MIEVHPPHENVHSWTQFFIHIAAITIGIYEDIAIIMEQSTEMGARIEAARAIARRSPDGNLTPRDIEELITVTF